MFWDDISSIKSDMDFVKSNFIYLSEIVFEIRHKIMQGDSERQINELKDLIKGFFFIEDHEGCITIVHDKLDRLIEDQNRIEALYLAAKTLDKFEDYMKNVDKLNAMMNEFKGCVAVARAALEERKEAAEKEAKTAVLADMTKEIHKSMLAFIQAADKLESKAHFKIDAIYKAICDKQQEEQEEKKPVKRRAKRSSNKVKMV